MPRERLAPTETYGETNKIRQSLQAVGLPEGGGDLPQPTQTQEPSPLAQAIARAQSSRPPASYLTQPTQRASEPIQAGLRLGPGAGPEAVHQNGRARLVNLYESMAELTGDPAMRLLANRARNRMSQSAAITKRRFGPGRQYKVPATLGPATTVGKGRGVPGTQSKTDSRVRQGLGPGMSRTKTEDQGIEGQDGGPNRTGPK